MHSGEIWTLRDDAYASKARPVVVVQDAEVENFDSIVLCLLTSFDSDNISTRVKVRPTADNALTRDSFVMTEKIVTVDKTLLGKKIGFLDELTMKEIRNQLAFLLGIK